MYRGRSARNYAKQMVLEMKRTMAAIKIQAQARRMLARIATREMREHLRDIRAARKLQAIYRGRLGRRAVNNLRHELRLNRSALFIQKRYRGRLGRRRFEKVKQARAEKLAATKIQVITQVEFALFVVSGPRSYCTKAAPCS